MIGETEGIKIYVNNETYAEYKGTLEEQIEILQQENQELKEQLLVTQTNEETFRLEMEDITQTLGLDEDTIFDDVKTYARSLKENKILRENAEHNDKVVDKVNWENMLLKKENEQLKDNWNKLREYIKETKLKEFEKDYGKRYGKTFTQAEIIVCNMILDKIQELEKGSDK